MKNIKKKLEVFEENADRILVTLEDDDPRKDDLKTRRDDLSEEVKKNENEVNSRMKEIENFYLTIKKKKQRLGEIKKLK